MRSSRESAQSGDAPCLTFPASLGASQPPKAIAPTFRSTILNRVVLLVYALIDYPLLTIWRSGMVSRSEMEEQPWRASA